MTLLALLVSAALLVILGTVLLNAALFPRLRPQPPRGALDGGGAEVGGFDRAAPIPARDADGPAVLIPARDADGPAVLIPARDEAAVIAATVGALLAQVPPPPKLLVLDDGSTDDTTELARAAGAGDPRLRVMGGQPPPPGWLGKNWACWQLAQAAAGAEVLVFTDAEVTWTPGALAAVLAEFERSGADLLTIFPTQQTLTWGERLTVPFISLAILGYLPLPLAHSRRWPLAAAANGQCGGPVLLEQDPVIRNPSQRPPLLDRP